jgi:hypothetical protein
MIFVGNFSFTREGHHGHFSCLIEADNVEEANPLFRDRIDAFNAEGGVLEECRVFLDSVVELPSVMSEGAIVGFEEVVGAKPVANAFDAFGEVSAVYGPADEENPEPFVRFEAEGTEAATNDAATELAELGDEDQDNVFDENNEGFDDVPDPLWLVRWPNLSAALVRASSEQHLEDILDEVADPGGCRWQRYDGPVWFEVELPIEFDVDEDERDPNRPMGGSDVSFTNLADAWDNPLRARASIPDGDTAFEMLSAIGSWAFPNIHALAESADVERAPDHEDLEALATAARNDLSALSEHSWRWAQLRRRVESDDTGPDDDPEPRGVVRHFPRKKDP